MLQWLKGVHWRDGYMDFSHFISKDMIEACSWLGKHDWFHFSEENGVLSTKVETPMDQLKKVSNSKLVKKSVTL